MSASEQRCVFLRLVEEAREGRVSEGVVDRVLGEREVERERTGRLFGIRGT